MAYQDELDTIEMDCIEEDPTQPIHEPSKTLPKLTPARKARKRVNLEPLPLTPLPLTPAPLVPLPLPEPHEPQTLDESTHHNRTCTTVQYHPGVEIDEGDEDSDLIPLPRHKESDTWHVDTSARTRPFRRIRRDRRKRRRR